MARPKGSKNAIQPTKQQQKMLQDVAESAPDKSLQISHPKKKLFIETYYALNGNVTQTCKTSGISRRTFYDWLESDSQFHEIIQEQEQQVLDELKAEAYRRALDKNKENDTMLIFTLKSKHPEFKPQRESIAFQDSSGSKFVLTRGN